jgi:hypothetical protein
VGETLGAWIWKATTSVVTFFLRIVLGELLTVWGALIVGAIVIGIVLWSIRASRARGNASWKGRDGHR